MTTLLDKFKDRIADLTPDEFAALSLVLEEFSQSESSDLLKEIRNADFKFQPVSPREWITNSYYCGDDCILSLYPRYQDEFEVIFTDPKIEVVCLLSSLGVGKDFFTKYCIGYIKYELAALRTPQLYFPNIAKSSNLCILNLSLSAEHAKSVFFDQLRDFFDSTPFFKDHDQRDKKYNDRLIFPSHQDGIGSIVVEHGNSTAMSAVGQDLFTVVCDEVNFLPKVANSKRAMFSLAEYDAAKIIISTVRKRIASRFNYRGYNPGKIFLLSSTGSIESSYLEKMVYKAERQKDPSIKVLRLTPMDVKPKESFSNKFFRVGISSKGGESKILKPNESFDGKVMEFPVDYKNLALSDVDDLLRDVGSIPVGGAKKFFNHWQQVLRNFTGEIPHPFTKRVTTLEDGAYLEPWFKPRTDVKYFFHVDLALSQDAAGVCICHVEGYKDVNVPDPERGTISEHFPIIYVDLLLTIVPPRGQQIQLHNIRQQIFYEMIQRQFIFGKSSLDGFQSADTLQILTNAGMDVYRLSVDLPGPYDTLKRLIGNTCVRSYMTPVLEKELHELERGKGGKVDHSPRGSKDLSDAFCGACYNAFQWFLSDGQLFLVPDEDIKDDDHRDYDDDEMEDYGVRLDSDREMM